MKNPKSIGSRIAYGGIGAAVSVVFILLGYFVPVVSLSCTVLTAVGIILPLCKGYFREAILASVVAGVIGFFIVNIKIVPYAMASGPYVVLTVFLKLKFFDKTWKKVLSYALKILYSALVFWVCYKLVGVIAFDPSRLEFLDNVSEIGLYAILNAVFSLAFLVYDFLLIRGFYYAKEKLKTLKK